MRLGSLFSGVGGFELAAAWMGWENVFSCEINPFGRKVLQYYWPKAKHYEDIKKTDFSIYRGRIDILTGGFPCQPFSLAGNRKGTEDDRHLWPFYLKTIQTIRPRWVVGENVYGLINWDGGLVFESIQADLEAEGYEVIPIVLPACAINAPHRRDRIWFIAYRNVHGFNGCNGKHEELSSEGWVDALNDTIKNEGEGNATDSNSKRWRERNITAKSGNEEFDSRNVMHSGSTGKQREHIGRQGEGELNGSDSGNGIINWENFPTQSPICSGNDEFSSRLDGITFPKWRNESIKAYGNAVVPELVYELFKVINEMDNG